ncbi:protein VASCULATURE COMPLEXITY AND CONNECTIVITY-like [Magnolia sinica]|uniref:protein VASCULATURE COMPLEXITY AND CONNECTIVITY-like n=1 Tax=Magnolia sinica TaxID=86752 RepID=UPI002657C1D2|nr:protein VASCULATURE COMPLEXITY AND CONNECTIVITY-like [Magnolia sinica]XP_058103893.1 protein VASCULATURE COMPLEXITY AND CONNECTIVITY-like [Magnolia sinica]
MERKEIVVCICVGFLGMLAAALGFAAEAKRIKVSDVQSTSSGVCTYPRSPALALGLTAGVALVLAQAILNTAAGCICCKKQPHFSRSKRIISLSCFVVSWVAFVIAFLLLLTGTVLNDEHGEGGMYFDDYCYVVKGGVFSGGAILSLASLSLGIFYYVTLSSAKNTHSWGPHHNQGIMLAQPQFPPGSMQPVFMPEDTYNRQQIP